MNRIVFIHDAQGEHRVNEADLPLCVGGAETGDVVLPDLPATAVVAYIARADGHVYIQAADASLPLFHNHERLSASAWLKSGDQVQAGEAVLQWTVKGDQVFITVRRRTLEPELAPPPGPPPAPLSRTREIPAVADPAPDPHGHRTLRRLVAVLFAVLVLAAAFVLLATPLALRFSPEPEAYSLSGFPPAVPVGGRLLVIPGRYTVHATRDGYRPLEETVEIARGGFRELAFQLEELPGRVTVQVAPEVPFRLFAGDVAVAVDADGVAEIERGTQQLRLETGRYLPETRALEVAGLGKAQTVAFTLQPAWADVHLSSRPAGAEVQVDDASIGTTPLDTEILHGQRTIVLSLAGHKPVTLQREIKAGATLRLEDIALQPADGQLALSSTPAGATLSVDGDFHGTTPATLTLSSGSEHRLRLSKPGYQTTDKAITLAAAGEQTLAIELPPEFGIVFVTARPADTRLMLDGKPAGEATRRLRLTTRPHTLEFRKPGYVSRRVTVTPRAGISQNVDVILKTVAGEKAAATSAVIKTALGQPLRLIRPAGNFRMGASRREAGRRANESRRLAQLERPFYLSVKEVTNGAFRRFRPSHNSGSAEGAALNSDTQPVVNVSWDDAARYCNWLGKQDGLPAAYREAGAHMVPVVPLTTGYRLPTEAEWAYVARAHGRNKPARYPWSGSYPPTSLAGNFADARIADTLADVVPGYDDNYRGTAPVGSFAARPQGFHDLGGNVAEWTHDFYAVYPGDAERLVTDPTGPAAGDHHVVRDSSWRHGSITELRLSYRDYSRTPRNDLGFRIARYAR
ncbi:MAG: SUMF1/EgtB/PvdO family nonheme iron enzyme [Pseudomonadota bacterium]|nr:SUMF1/EgtB/PvdO family nonheme iron enzyme [Pseudomonadota bacterium]